jgi:hypothetical protein
MLDLAWGFYSRCFRLSGEPIHERLAHTAFIYVEYGLLRDINDRYPYTEPPSHLLRLDSFAFL